MDGSGTGRGEARAPAALRAAGLVEALDATDLGDLQTDVTSAERDPRTGVVGFSEIVHGSRVIRDAVATGLVAGRRPLVVGGCCSVVPGALAGARHHTGPFRLVFVDGHLDLFDGQTSTTGELAGMDLAVAIGHGPRELVGLAQTARLVEESDVVAVGDGDARRRAAFGAPGPSEVAPGITVIDAEAIAAEGADAIGARLGREVGTAPQPYWLHLDADVIDQALRPAVTYPVDTGIGWDALATLLAGLGRSPRLIGVSVTDLNVDLDPDGATARALVDLIGAVFGARGGA
jgi:arginase